LGKKDDRALICESGHAEKLKSIVPAFKYIIYSAGGTTARIFKSVLILLQRASFKKNDIIFLSFDNTLVPLLSIILYPLLFRNSLSLILHNNLKTLKTNKFKRFVYLLMVKIYKAKPYVLSKEMKRIYDFHITPSVKCTLLPHPNYIHLIEFNKVKGLLISRAKTNVVILGRQAQLITPFLENHKLSQFVNVHFTIACSGPVPVIKDGNVTVLNKRLNYDEYYSLLSEADFALFALDKTVEYRASGILMDCISLQCPIIAPCTGHFLEYKEMGIGYFYNDYNELDNIFNTINSSDRKSVESFKLNFKDALQYSTPDNLSVI